MAAIKNIIFDMGGVLLDLDRQKCVDEFSKLGFPEADELLNPYRQKGIFMELEKGTAEPEQLYEYIKKNSQANITASQIDNALNSFLTALPSYKLDMLLELRREYNIFMLSNTNKVMMPHIRQHYFSQQGLAIEDYFDKLYLSYEMKMLKPDPEIYHEMVSDSGMIPSESLFLDDGPANVETARQLGFNVYLVEPHEDYRHIFQSLNEI